MPSPNETSNKISYLAQFAINEYELDPNLMDSACNRTDYVNTSVALAGFSETDVFISESGIYSLVAYKKDKNIEITILYDDEYDIYVESNGCKLEYLQNLPLSEVIKKLNNWGEAWDTSEFYQGTLMIKNWEDLIQLHSSTTEQAESQLLKVAVSYQTMLPLAAT